MTTAPVPRTKLLAGCKVNIYLNILRLREDGYHDLETLFLPLPTPHDILTITPGAAGAGLYLSCSMDAVPREHNIISICYDLFGSATGIYPDLNVHLQKNIPMGAGLGGGSSDAAVFLRFLNSLAGNRRLDDAALHLLAAKLGADVPFFLLRKPAWATGRGELLTPVKVVMDELSMLLVCPDVHISTAWAYKAWDERYREQNSPPFPLTRKNRPDMFLSLSNFVFYNSFELPVFNVHPRLRIVKEMLLGSGAAGAVLSGSGASIFSVFRVHSEAERAAARARELGIPVYLDSSSRQHASN